MRDNSERRITGLKIERGFLGFVEEGCGVGNGFENWNGLWSDLWCRNPDILECWGLRSSDEDETEQDLNFDVNFRDLRIGNSD